jgi:hypothetical protein
VPVTLNEAVAEGIGKAFGTVALAQGETVVAVGRDGRLSGPALSAAMVRGVVPVVVLRFEGQTPEALHRIETAMLALLHKVKPDAKIGASAH